MSLTLTVLGCSGSYPVPDNPCSGYLVRSPGATVVVDMGSGTLANLQRHVAVGDVDAVILTHRHPDHWLDLAVLRSAMRYYLSLEGLAVYSTPELLAQAESLMSELEPTFDWTTIDASSVLRIGDQAISFSRTDHPVETLAVRIEAGNRTLVYTADTGSAWNRGEFVDGVDLLACESTLSTEYEDKFQHLSGQQAGALAAESAVGLLVLTHIGPDADAEEQRSAAAEVFDGPIELAGVHKTYVV